MFICRYQKRVSNIIDDVLEWSPTLAISGMMDKQTVNVTGSDNDATDGTKVGAENVTQHDDTGISDVYETEEGTHPDNYEEDN